MIKMWTNAEIEYLKTNYGTQPYKAIAQTCGKTVGQVKQKASRLKITVSRSYTPEQKQTLIDMYPDNETEEIARVIGRSVRSVWNMAHKLRVQKTEEYWTAKLQSHGEQLRESGRSHRYPKGHVPANKGLRRPGWNPGDMAKTQFKKGGLPHNHQPVGTIVIVDGYQKIKVAEPKTWEYLHRKVWMEGHGEIPDGHCVVFKDHDSLNCEPANLELITREEMMSRNTLHNYPEPLKAAIHQLAGMKRRINNHAKKQDRGSQEHPV